MTISTTDSRIQYTGNAVTTAFSFPYRFLENADLLVTITTPAGVTTTQVLGTDYTVTGADLDAGGTVTMTDPPATGELLTIRRVLDLTQETDYQSGDPFPAESHERALDKLTMVTQQLQEQLTRTLQLPPESNADTSAIDVEAVEVVAGIAADVSAVAAVDTEVAAVAGIDTEVVAVAGNSANIATVAADSAAINTAATNIAAIIAAPGAATTASTAATTATTQAGIATTQAGNAATSATNAANSATAAAGSATAAAASAAAAQVRNKIEPISASVASNALTLTLNPTVLDFRSATLGSGAVNTRTVASAISLVISSGSTLGTVSGQASRIVVLALDNAGTVELAAVNLAGGVNLDETGVVSTTAEGGAGAADSATVIYSATARTNVPYRVLGYVESTQTTAGTWSTAPSSIVGAGAQALGALMSLGYGQTWQNLTGSRAFGTTYTNATGRPIFVCVSSNNPQGVNVSMTATVNGVTVVGQQGYSPAGNIGLSLSFVVPHGQTYSITAVAATLSAWAELR